MVLYMTPSRRATTKASETRGASVPRSVPRPSTRASFPSAFMAIAEVSLRVFPIRGRRDGFRVAFARRRARASTRLPKRERRRGGRRRRRRGGCGRRLDAAPDASDFFRTRPRAHAERPLRVWARSGASRARAARRAAATGDDAGVEVFSFLFFSSIAFFFAARQHPVPAKPGLRSGRAVARSPPRANRPPTREKRDGTLAPRRLPPRSRARRGRGGRGGPPFGA